MTEDRGFTPHELEQFNRNIEAASDHLRSQGVHERHAAEWLRKEVGLRTKWDEHDTRMRLQDRADHVEAIRVRLQEAFDLVEQEIKILTDAKNGLDKGLTGRHDLIMNVNGECKSLHEARQGINNVHDEVETQLRLVVLEMRVDPRSERTSKSEAQRRQDHSFRRVFRQALQRTVHVDRDAILSHAFGKALSHPFVHHGQEKESELAAHIKRELNHKSVECSKLLEELNHVKNLLHKDLHDKKEAVDIDLQQLALTTASTGLSLKPDILRVPSAMVTMRVWLNNSIENMRLTARLLDAAQVLRNQILALWSRVEHEFKRQVHATDYEYRKRYSDTLLATRRLEHNRQNLADEIKAVENDIEATEKAWEAVVPYQMLAHTRIENRNQRPNYELVLDPPHEGLVLEATNLAHSRDGLFQKLKALRARWNDLTEQLHRVELDLERKMKCLEMDKRAINLREATFLPHMERDATDFVTDRSTKVFSMDPDQRYKKHVPRVLV